MHLIFGSPGGRLTLDQVTDVLRELGVEATATRDARLQPRGVALTLATTPDGEPLLVKIFGRDAADGQLVAATWYAIWHRGAKHVRAGRLEQVEHEAFLTLAAERAGVPVMAVVAAGETDQSDAILVIDANGRTLGSPSRRHRRRARARLLAGAPEASTSSGSRTGRWTPRA